MATYTVGKTIRLRAVFAVDDVDTDPTTISLIVQSPAGTDTTYTYAAGQIVRDAAGSFYYDLTLSAAGNWSYRWVGTGAAASVEEGSVHARASRVI